MKKQSVRLSLRLQGARSFDIIASSMAFFYFPKSIFPLAHQGHLGLIWHVDRAVQECFIG